MLRVGLSGGIGSGKSTVSARLAELGARVIDADRVAREVVAPGTPALAEIVDRFGAGLLDQQGALDRPALGRIVFSDPVARRGLEAITHPRISQRTAELMHGFPSDAIVVHDVPLLVEKAMGAAYHLVVIVGADADERLRRLVQDRGMAAGDARQRIASQADDTARRAAADVWLDNSGTPLEITSQVDRLWTDRLVPFEHNVREGVPVHRPETLRISEPDPTWSWQADRLTTRLGRAMGKAALRVDHVGSTSVPAMPAKDVIDLQVVVADLSVLDDSDVARSLADAGFVAGQGEWWDHVHGGAGGTWPKRSFNYADPARVVHVHVRSSSSPAWRMALLFVAWLRDDPVAHADYRSLKERLLARGLSSSQYAEAKEPWFVAAIPRAEQWAARAGWSIGTADSLPRGH